MNNVIEQDMQIEIDGMGFAIYSEEAMKNVGEGEDFFSNEFSKPQQVAEHINKGDITGFCTGSGGSFELKIREGYPENNVNKEYPISIRLALNVVGGRVCIKDIFWLMDWCSECPQEQTLEIKKGIYHLTILTRKPNSGIWGDNQVIYIFFESLDKMPELAWKGVPELFVD